VSVGSGCSGPPTAENHPLCQSVALQRSPKKQQTLLLHITLTSLLFLLAPLSCSPCLHSSTLDCLPVLLSPWSSNKNVVLYFLPDGPGIRPKQSASQALGKTAASTSNTVGPSETVNFVVGNSRSFFPPGGPNPANGIFVSDQGKVLFYNCPGSARVKNDVLGRIAIEHTF